MLQRRHILAATALHVALMLLVVFASEFRPTRLPQPQPRIIEAVMLDPTPTQMEQVRQEELAEQQRQRELEEQRQRQQEQERQRQEERRRQQEEEARRRAEAEARERRERELAEQRRRDEEQQRQEEERRRQQEAERRQREEEERRQREEEERRQREEAERRQREEAERRRAEEERRRAEEEARRRALQEQIEAEERARREGAAIRSWTPVMERHIARFWRRPPELATARDLSAVLRVTILPDGTVTSVQVVESSGNIAFDRSAQRAVEAASPLPQPDGGFFFREFRTRFQPE